MSIRMDCFGLSDVGRAKQTNEDQFLIADLNKSMRIHQTSVGHNAHTRLFGSSQGKLLIVADGMGDDASGNRASTIMIDSITAHVLDPMRWFFQLSERGHSDFRDDLKTAVTESNKQIRREIDAHPRQRGMSTTVTLAYLIWPKMYIVHVGDSRCYRKRQSSLTQITRDHSSDERRPSDARHKSSWQLLLSDVVGTSESGEVPELYETTLKLGDTVLLCTDGLTKHVCDEQIAKILDGQVNAENACQQLVNLADRQGGSDNITVVVARFLDQEQDQEAFSLKEEVAGDDSQRRRTSDRR